MPYVMVACNAIHTKNSGLPCRCGHMHTERAASLFWCINFIVLAIVLALLVQCYHVFFSSDNASVNLAYKCFKNEMEITGRTIKGS